MAEKIVKNTKTVKPKSTVKKVKKAEKKAEKVVVKTQAKFLRISPRKLRLVINSVRDLNPDKSLIRLKYLNMKGGEILSKAIKTAVSDAVNNYSLDRDSLIFKALMVNEGPRLKRMDKSHSSRFNRGLIQKRMSHLIVEVEGVAKNGS